MREVTRTGTPVRVHSPAPHGEVKTVTVRWDRADWAKVSLLGFGVGLLCAYIFLSISAHWVYGLAGLASGILSGVMLGIWLTGEETAARRNGAGRANGVDERVRALVASGRSVVVTEIGGRRVLERVRRTLESAGAEVFVTEPPRGGLLLGGGRPATTT